MKNLIKKIKIKPSFYVVIFLMFFLRLIDYFLLICFFVFLHELSHILFARFFGLKTSKIIITPIGQIAKIDGLETLKKSKKILVILAGPLCNLLFAILLIFSTNEKMQLIKNINLSIAFFNLIPAYPLDGGRILQYILNEYGDLKSSIIIKKLSKFLSLFIFFLGFLQIIIIPYNLSLFCIGFYLIKINKNEYLKFNFEFYKNLKNKKNNRLNQIIKIKQILVNKTFSNKSIFMNLSQDFYTIINIYDTNNIKWKITEDEFINYIQVKGINGNIFDVIKNNIPNNII